MHGRAVVHKFMWIGIISSQLDRLKKIILIILASTGSRVLLCLGLNVRLMNSRNSMCRFSKVIAHHIYKNIALSASGYTWSKGAALAEVQQGSK